MNIIIPDHLLSHYQRQANKLAREIPLADGIILSEPIGAPIAQDILAIAEQTGNRLPPVIRAEIGNPLWTRYLRERAGVKEQDGNPYFDFASQGHISEEYRVDFRKWLVEQQNLPAEQMSAPVRDALQALTDMATRKPQQPVRIIALAHQPFEGDDSDPYVLDDLAHVISPDHRVSISHQAIMTNGWLRETGNFNSTDPEARQALWIVEKASYDPQSLPPNERPLVASIMADLSRQLTSQL